MITWNSLPAFVVPSLILAILAFIVSLSVNKAD